MPKLRKDVRIIRGQKLSISEWRSFLEPMLSKLVTSKGICEAAGLGHCGGNLQLSHVLPKGTYRHLQFDIINVQSLCYVHHMLWWHRNPMEAYEWFSKTYPERWIYLQSVRNKFIKLDNEYYLKVYKAIKEKDLNSLVIV